MNATNCSIAEAFCAGHCARRLKRRWFSRQTGLIAALWWWVGLAGSHDPVAARPTVTEPEIYSGTCSASAAVPLGSDRFVVADDESNRLRVYSRARGGPPQQIIDLSSHLELERRGGETDIEGAALLGDRAYWITSHSRDKDGDEHPNRYRFFATSFQAANSRTQMVFVGSCYKDLVRDLGSSPVLRSLNLHAASLRPPKAKGGLNIEGLCAGRPKQLLIAFRNPVVDGRALLVPLLNPDDLSGGRAAAFGEPILLDLDGLGIRDIAKAEGKYLIIAGSYAGGGKTRLFTWDGFSAKPKQVKGIDLKGLNPEALVVYPDTGLRWVQVLSDDSSEKDGGVSCIDLRESARHFRSVWVKDVN